MPAIDIDPRDRILLVGVPPAEELRAIALQARDGLVVAVGPDEAVRAARKALADLDSVMLVVESDDGRLPWQDGFFTKVFAPHPSPADTEVYRVLAPGGTIHSASTAHR